MSSDLVKGLRDGIILPHTSNLKELINFLSRTGEGE